MPNSTRLRDPLVRAAALVGSIDDGFYPASPADRLILVEAVTQDLAAAADQAIATDILVAELDIRVDALETTTVTLTGQASVTNARVDQLATQADALTQDRAVAADHQTALLADIARRRAMIDARLATAAENETALLADLALRRAAIDARLEKIERLIESMGALEDTAPAHEIEQPRPLRSH